MSSRLTRSKLKAYPKQPINLIIPLAPGDATDVAGRTIGEGLSKLLKVPVVAVNRPGAGGTIGTDSAVKAPKDGYTILITNNASLVFNRVLTPDAVPYDPFKDLTPLGMAVRTPIILAVHKDAPFKNFAEMIDYGKKNPGGIRIGTVGPGSVGHFTVEIVNSLSRRRYDDDSVQRRRTGVTAALGGHIEGAAAAQGVVAEHLKAGTMRGIVASSKMPEFPQIPTLAQLGYKQNLARSLVRIFRAGRCAGGSVEKSDRRPGESYERPRSGFEARQLRLGRRLRAARQTPR